jgi:hypothetical protein
LSRIGALRGLALASPHFLLQAIERVGHLLIFSGPFQKLLDSGVALVRNRPNQAPTFHCDVSEILWIAHSVSSGLRDPMCT